MPWLYCLLAAVLLGPDLAAAAPVARSGKRVVHVVEPGETLAAIALHYQVSLGQLRQWNRLRGDKILVGQKLQVWVTPAAELYRVKRGDTLARIAAQYGVSPGYLRQLNGLKSDKILMDQRLKVPRQETPPPPPPPPLPPPPRAAVDSSARLPASQADSLPLPAPAAADSLPVAETDSAEAPADSLEEEAADSLDYPVPSSLEPALADSLDEGPPEEYVVRPGDSLAKIAERFEVGVGLLRQLNRLKKEHIHPGQKLRLRPSWQDEGIHVVQPGETLAAIALAYHLDLERLRKLNGIEGGQILVGQKLRLRAAPLAVHIVERGDALWEIAAAYGMEVEELKRLNGLTSDRVFPGQELKLKGKKLEHYEIYVVQKGDNLTEIADLYQMSVAELKRLNKLGGSVIHPGDKLKTRPLLGQGPSSLEPAEIDWGAVQLAVDGIRRIEAENGPYYFQRPAADRQSNSRYFESSPAGPLAVYQQAHRLWQSFEAAVSRMGRLSRTLEGWHVVIDPGHGGLDPGTIVEALDGNGDKLYVVEDEYVYDIAIRAYVLLRLHGAQVSMTLLSPNHLLRHTTPPTQTFVNEKNEVYNSYELNQANRRQDWPRGANLSTRVRLARRAFADTPRDHRIFLSFHADIDPRSPAVPLVLYYTSRNGRRQDLVSRNFARSLLSSLGAGARTRGQPLGVLRDNPAQVKVLLELRNLAYTDQVWALRFEQLRQRDAEKVVRGILDYVRRRNLSARR